MSHADRAEAVLAVAVRQATKGHLAASGPLIRQHVRTCLSTALAICDEDAVDMYRRIDEAREALAAIEDDK